MNAPLHDPAHPGDAPRAARVLERVALRATTLGDGLPIRRALPTRQRRMVGAWCFLDHIGPVQLPAGQGLHVGAHPHTGLQTFTWMIEGELLHRDSLGSAQRIRPGQVNLMTAGHGIVHTEDTPPDTARVHAAQLWIALPPAQAGTTPAFEHHPVLPGWTQDGLRCTLLAGRHGPHQAPTQVHTPLLGLDLAAGPQAATTTLALEPGFEYGLLPLQGEVQLGGEALGGDEFAYLGAGHAQLRLALAPGARALLLGGEPFAPPIVMWWNFVGFDRAYLSRAQADWEAGSVRFPRVAGDEGRRLAAPPLPWRAPPA